MAEHTSPQAGRSTEVAQPLGAGVLALALALGACQEVIEHKVLHRGACQVCHQPLVDGFATGIEEAHPWSNVSCVACHGGKDRVCDGVLGGTAAEPTCDGPWIYDLARSHPPSNGPAFIKNLSGERLDAVDLDYLRFVNHGDYRVVDRTCGRCHAAAVEVARASTMAHTSGELTVARYRAGQQASAHGEVAAVDLEDSSASQGGVCAVEQLERFEPPLVDPASVDAANAPTVANLQDQYLVKSCLRCHTNDFGENRFAGDFRSSGCTACHMPYAEDGRYVGSDPWVNRQTVPHPARHELTLSPPITACTTCHYRGGRIGVSFQGYRESAGSGLNPEAPKAVGRPLHGHDAAYYLEDEDSRNDFDETPPDAHFRAGMHCVDCHAEDDVHGDGHLYADTQCAVGTACVDCHGTARARAAIDPRRDNLVEVDGRLKLRTRVTRLELDVPQVIDAVTRGAPGYSDFAAIAMGVDANGFSHSDELACTTCHAGWYPSCYGCHVEVDLTKSAAYHTSDLEAPGKPAGSRKYVMLHDLVLMRDSEGLMAPSMPAERFFMTALVADGDGTKPLFSRKPRSFPLADGGTMAGFGQRAFNPHTTQKTSPFMACDRCHSAGSVESPTNAALLDLTYGFGTERFIESGCDVSNSDPSCDPVSDVTDYRLDAIQTRDGTPLVVVGHADPMISRPLTLTEIARMRAVLVPEDAPLSTPIPADARTNRTWPGPLRRPDNVYPPPHDAPGAGSR